MNILSLVTRLFKADNINYQGVRLINVYGMRLFFTLMAFFVGMDSWSQIFNHQGNWEPMTAMAVSVWAAYSTLSFLGIFKTLKMLPIMVFMVFYKSLWLTIVAYPLWVADKLAGSNAEAITNVFIWVVIPIVLMPWGYVFKTYVWDWNSTDTSKRQSQRIQVTNSS